MYFIIKLPGYNYTHEFKLDARMFCFISVVLTEQLFKNLDVFYSSKVQHASDFTIIEEGNVSSLQECGKTTFYWSSNIQVLSLLSKLIVKIKRSHCTKNEVLQ